MKKTLILALGFLSILSGCIELQEKISIRKDGSGYYQVKQILSKELTSMLQTGMKAATTKSDLPITQEELETSFQGKGVKIRRSSFEVVDGRLSSRYLIEFQNATEFFKVPAMQKRFRFFKQGDRLVLKSIPKSNMKPGAQPFSPRLQTTSSTESMAAPTMNKFPEENQELQKALQESMKALLHGFKIAITVELPNRILDSNATHTKGRMASWIVDEKIFSDLEKAKSLGDHLWVMCSLKGLSFRPSKEEDIFMASARQPGKNVSPSSQFPEKKHPETPESKSPDTLTSGGRSTVFLKNGNYIQVDGYHREGDMINFMKYDGTFSLPIAIIKSIQKPDYE